MSRLSIFRDDAFVGEHPLLRPEIALGRDPENDIVLDDKTLSRFHAKVVRRGARFVVVDLGALNGVHLNGERITGESDLSPGDEITLGPYRAVFEIPESTRPDGGDAPAAPEAAELEIDVDADGDDDDDDVARPASTPVAGAPTLILLFNGMEVSRHPVGAEGAVVGRSKQCDVVISLLGLSRRHARIFQNDQGEYLVEDFDSQNGTWVNNERIPKQKVLHHRDLLNFYDYSVLFLADGQSGIESKRTSPGSAVLGTDEFAARETGGGEGNPSLVDAPVNEVAEDLGSGSYLGKDFDPPSAHEARPSAADELFSEDEEALRVEPDMPRTSPTDALIDDLGLEDFAPPTGQSERSGTADLLPPSDVHVREPGLEFEDRTSATDESTGLSAAVSAQERPPWPTDLELERALGTAHESELFTLEVTLGEKPYTEVSVSQTATRLGTDPRCEFALPKASGLRPWHCTLVLLGASLVLYRASRLASLRVNGSDVDKALLRAGDTVELGRVRLKVRSAE